MDKYFDIQNQELLEKYPDIKVLKELEPKRVAYYCYYGKNPEHGAFEVIASWLKSSGLDYEKDRLRIFGYNNPSPTSMEQEEYGYEVCVTVPEGYIIQDARIHEKQLEGGLYAICNVKSGVGEDLGRNIMGAWQQFSKWVKDSKYQLAEHQWLEEHLQFDDEFQHISGIDLYLPIKLKRE